MASTRAWSATRPHPVHAILLGYPIALFTGALIADIAYLNTAEMQWSNFAAWLITGALVFGGVVLALALLGSLVWRRPVGRNRWLYPGLLALMWVVGLLDAFRHSADAWASVGAGGLFMTASCTILALAAGWVAHSAPRQENAS